MWPIYHAPTYRSVCASECVYYWQVRILLKVAKLARPKPKKKQKPTRRRRRIRAWSSAPEFWAQDGADQFKRNINQSRNPKTKNICPAAALNGASATLAHAFSFHFRFKWPLQSVFSIFRASIRTLIASHCEMSAAWQILVSQLLETGNPADAIGKAADLQVAPVCPVQEDYRKQPASQLASHPAS